MFFSLFTPLCAWITGLESDLQTTDRIAAEVIRRLRNDPSDPLPVKIDQQFGDNLLWIGKFDPLQ